MKDMGKVMAAMKERYAGQMDFGQRQRALVQRPACRRRNNCAQ